MYQGIQDGLQVSDLSNWGWQCHSPSKEIEEKEDWGKDNRLREEYSESETPEEQPRRGKE